MATFYTDINDTNLAADFQLKQPDIFIMKHEIESTATLTRDTSGTDTLTDTTQAMTPGEYISTVGLNLYIRDDNDKLAEGKVINNLGTTIQFEADNMTLVEDGTSAPALTNGTSYSYRVLTPSAKYAYGEFLGYVNEPTWAPEQEVAEFKYGIPRQKIREDLLENMHAINANIFSTRYNIQVAMFGMTATGSQTNQKEYHFGSNSFNNDYYQIAIFGKDVDDKDITYVFFKTKFRPNGEISFGAEEYKSFPATFPIFRDTLRDSTSVDFGFYRTTDS